MLRVRTLSRAVLRAAPRTHARPLGGAASSTFNVLDLPVDRSSPSYAENLNKMNALVHVRAAHASAPQVAR
jgi:hypothetical protein